MVGSLLCFGIFSSILEVGTQPLRLVLSLNRLLFIIYFKASMLSNSYGGPGLYQKIDRIQTALREILPQERYKRDNFVELCYVSTEIRCFNSLRYF